MAKRKTHEEFIEDVFNIFGDEYTILNTYKSFKDKILVRHNPCGREHSIRPDNFLLGKKCIKCYGKSRRKSHNEFVAEVNELGEGSYEVVSEYVKDNEKVIIKHIPCGNEYDVKPTKFLQGQRCPKCKKSKGEVAISKILDNNSIKYKEQYRFSDCRNKFPLPFDFAILDKNDSVKMLIEFQGIQHYQPIGFLGGEERFNYTKNNDLIKFNYCENKNIPLLIISYKDFDILQDIINSALKEVRKE